MVIKSIKSGIVQAWANKRMILIFYLPNLFFGLLIMFPFRSFVNKFVGYSLMGTKLGERLNLDFIFEFLKYNSINPATIMSLFLFVLAIYWVVVLFLSGGAFSVFASREKYNPTLFWGSAAKYFGRFFRLLLWSLPVFAILSCLQFIETACERLLFGSDPYQYISYWGGWIKIGLRYISLLLCGLVFDYARIHAILNDEHKMRKSLWQGIKFAFTNFVQTFGLAFLLFIAGGAALVIYNPIANMLLVPNTVIVILLFVLQQGYIFFRMMLRLIFYSSQLYLYNKVSFKAETAEISSADSITMESIAT